MKVKNLNAIILLIVMGSFCLLPSTLHAETDVSKMRVNYSDDALMAFLIANTGVHEIREQAALDMEKLTTDEEKAELNATAETLISSAIKNAGLSVKEYNFMGLMIDSDKELKKRANAIAEMLSEVANEK